MESPISNITSKHLDQMRKELEKADVHILVIVYDNKTNKMHTSYYGCLACIRDIFKRSIGSMKDLKHNKEVH